MSYGGQITVGVDAGARPRYRRALTAALFGYLILTLRSPAGWSVGLWVGLAFLVIPVLVGLGIGAMRPARAGISPAYWCASIPMFLYSADGMTHAHSRLETTQDAGQELLVGFLVAVVYGIVAGAVAMAANAILSRLGGANDR